MKISLRFRLSFLLLVWAALCAAPAWSSSSAKADHLEVQLLAPEKTLTPGQPFHAGLYFKLEPGWHVYWVNAGDSGEPPKIQWQLPAGVTAGPMQYPAPKRLPLGPLMDFGYEGEVLFPMEMQTTSALPPGEVSLPAKVRWLVCREVCLPGKADLDIARTVSSSSTGTEPVQPDSEIYQRLIKALPSALPAKAQAVFSPSAEGMKLTVLTGKKETEGFFFPLEQDLISYAAPQPVTPLEKGLSLVLTKDPNLAQLPQQLQGVLVLSDGRSFQLTAHPGEIAAGSGAASSAAALLKASALAFFGGVILNLMPCVFPVLFLKGLSLVQSSGEERDRMRKHGLVYTLGILVSFWVVVAALLILRAGGQQLGWGFQFQSPVFLALMAMLLFFLGLSLAGQFEIGLLLTSAGSSLAQKQGYTGSFFTGVLATVVATPCTAPFMGAAIGFALSQSVGVTFAIFTALALGLAAPYLLLTFRPEWTRVLPRPGAWMEVLKQATAIPVFGTVIWLLWVFTQSAGANALVGLLSSLLLLAVTGWIFGRWPARRGASLSGFVVLLGGLSLAVWSAKNLSASSVSVEVTKSGAAQWQPWTPDAVEKYRSEGKAVFIDFTASWCLSCQVNERAVLRRAEVQERFAASNVVLLKADWTQHDDSIAQALARLGRSGVPTYVLYLPGQTQPKVLPEVLTTGIVLEALESVKTSEAAVQ